MRWKKPLFFPWTLAVALFLFPANISSRLLFVIDAETGDFSQWRNPTSGSAKHSVVTSPVCGGKHAFTWTQSGGRTESASIYFPKNTDLWFGWAVYFPKNFKISGFSTKTPHGGTPCISQLHGYSSACPKSNRSIMLFKIKESHFYIWCKNMARISKSYYRLGPVTREKWHHWLVHGKFTHTSDGFLTVWLNGKKVLDTQGSNWSTCTNGPYFKCGTYAGVPSGQSMYGDEFRAGTTREDVDPALFCGGMETGLRIHPPRPPQPAARSLHDAGLHASSFISVDQRPALSFGGIRSIRFDARGVVVPDMKIIVPVKP